MVYILPHGVKLPTILLITTITVWLFVLHFPRASPFPSIALVIATTKAGSFTWASKLKIPNLAVIPYIADDPNGDFHPPSNKGNEVMVYFSYIVDNYDNLPDFSVFVHDNDYAWHNDLVLEMTNSYALNHLNFDEVARRGYVNLKIDWQNGCPAWINTTITEGSPEFSDFRVEEPFMKPLFQDMFPKDPIPEIFGGPCCSQFAVSRAALQSLPKSWYEARIDWILNTELEDAISGRLFEHLWAYVWRGDAVDCEVEYKALCRLYRICFQEQEELDMWNGAQYLWEKSIRESDEDWKEHRNWDQNLQQAISKLGPSILRWKDKALARGRSKYMRWKSEKK